MVVPHAAASLAVPVAVICQDMVNLIDCVTYLIRPEVPLLSLLLRPFLIAATLLVIKKDWKEPEGVGQKAQKRARFIPE